MSCQKFEGKYKGPGEIVTILNNEIVKINSIDKLELIKLTEDIYSAKIKFENIPSGKKGIVKLLFNRKKDELVSGNNGLDILKFKNDKLIHIFSPPTTPSGKNISGIIIYDKIC